MWRTILIGNFNSVWINALVYFARSSQFVICLTASCKQNLIPLFLVCAIQLCVSCIFQTQKNKNGSVWKPLFLITKSIRSDGLVLFKENLIYHLFLWLHSKPEPVWKRFHREWNVCICYKRLINPVVSGSAKSTGNY